MAVNHFASDRIKSLRAALVSAGYRGLGGYKEFSDKETIFLGRKHNQKSVVAKAKKLGFPDVFASGKRSLALPKPEKSKKHVIQKYTKEKTSCMILKGSIVGLLNGVNEESRLEILCEVIKTIEPKRRRKFLMNCLEEEFK